MRQSFSAAYGEARDKFLAAAKAAGARLFRHESPAKGPGGEPLSTDVARIGAAEAERVLLTISATHGVEGFCGSGIQVESFAALKGALPPGIALVAVHAMNPYGFAWLRRVTQENVDLNRNFVDHKGKLPENPGYDQLADAICPTEWTDAALAAAQKRLDAFAEQHGAFALQGASSGGQYRHADGIFYGGSAPTASRGVFERVLKEHLGRAKKVAIIDFHTGLGPYGYGEPIVLHAPESAAMERAKSWWGEVTSPFAGNSKSAVVVGHTLSVPDWLLSGVEFTGLALEYGTLPLEEVMNALRADNWLHLHGDLASAKGKALKRQMREAFYGDADDWKETVAEQGIRRQRQALAGLAA